MAGKYRKKQRRHENRFWHRLWRRLFGHRAGFGRFSGPGRVPKMSQNPKKITTARPTFIASKNKTHEFERRGAPGSHFETLLGGSREHSGPHFGNFRCFLGTVLKGIPSHNPRLKSSKKSVHHCSFSFAGPPTSGAAVSR